MMFWNVFRVIAAVAYFMLLLRGLYIIDKKDRREQEARIETRRTATQRTAEAWAETYDNEVKMHNREMHAAQQEIKALQEQIEALERQLATWNMIGETTKIADLMKGDKK